MFLITSTHRRVWYTPRAFELLASYKAVYQALLCVLVVRNIHPVLQGGSGSETSQSWGIVTRLASGTWVKVKAKAGAQLQFQPALIASGRTYMEQGQSWGTVQFQSGYLASGILPELARVQHSSSQILIIIPAANFVFIVSLVFIVIACT